MGLRLIFRESKTPGFSGVNAFIPVTWEFDHSDFESVF